MATKYEPKKCGICLKKVTQYLTLTPGSKPLKFGHRGIPVTGPTVVCSADLRRIHT